MEETEDKKKQVGVLDRAIIIIRVLEATKGGMGLTEIARISNINKTTCYRILQTMMSDNLVETGDRPGTYRLGIRFLELGTIVQRRINIHQIAFPILNQLTQDTLDTSYLCILNKEKALCVERIEGDYYQVLTLNVGDSWPLHKGAAPRAILAFLEDEKINRILSSPIEKVTPKTPTDTEHYWSIIQEARDKGYVLSHEDVVLGVTSIGAPIYNHDGNVIASISISSTTERILPIEESKHVKILVEAANQISRSLGWDGENKYNI